MIILGGGVLEACKFFILPIVQKVVAGDAFANSQPGGRIVTAALGDDAVVLGAVALALQARGRDPFARARRTLQLFPVITDPGPGTITVGGETYHEDVYVRVDGKIGRRAKVRPPTLRRPPQQIGRDELKEVCKGNPSILIIGTGYDGAAALTPDGEEFLLKRGITYETLSTAEAVSTYNAIKGRKAALMHLGKYVGVVGACGRGPRSPPAARHSHFRAGEGAEFHLALRIVAGRFHGVEIELLLRRTALPRAERFGSPVGRQPPRIDVVAAKYVPSHS